MTRRHLPLVTAATLALLLATPAWAESPADPGGSTLDPGQFVRRVLDRNRLIKATDAERRGALARVASAGALEDPVISYNTTPETVDTKNGYLSVYQISQKIPWPGVLSLRTKAAMEEAGSVADQLADTRLRLAAKARAVYADWYYVHKALAINATDIALVERLRAVARAAYASGQAPQQDVLRAEVERLRLQNETLDLKRRETAVQADINQLLDTGPAAAVPPPGPRLPEPDVPADLNRLNAIALAQNPALTGWNKQVSASRDRVALAEDGFYPNLTFMAGQNQLMQPYQKQYTVGVSINIPFGANHTGELDDSYAALDTRQQRYLALKDQLLADLSQTYAALRQLHDSIALYDGHLLPVATLDLRAAEADYRTGDGDFTKVIAAEQQLLKIELERERARADYFIQFASLDYQTGGRSLTDQAENQSP